MTEKSTPSKSTTGKAAEQKAPEKKTAEQLSAEKLEKARKAADATVHGDNPIVDVYGLPIPGDPQLLPGEVQTVGGVVTIDGPPATRSGK